MIQKKVNLCQTAILLHRDVSTLTKFSIFAPLKTGKSVKNIKKAEWHRNRGWEAAVVFD